MESIVHEPVRGTIGDLSALRLPGLEAMRRSVRGNAPNPPVHHLFGLTPTEVGLGTSTFTMPVTPWLEDAFGIIWGGTFALVADGPIATALYTGLPPGKVVSTSELSINYLRPTTADSGRLVARGRSVYLGRTVGVSEATIEDGAGRTMAHATTRCVIQDVPFDPDAELTGPSDPIADPPDPYLRPVPEELYQDISVWDERRKVDVQRSLSGNGRSGPLQHLTGIEFVHAKVGAVSATIPASPWFSTGGPAMYGGVLALACDTVLTGAVWSTLHAGAVAASLDLQVRFLRPVMLDGSTLDISGWVVHDGRSIKVAQAEITNAEGKTVAIATGSSMVMEGAVDQLVAGRRVDDVVRTYAGGGA
ncbi:MAG: PaaI family thioesterase [Acidimicrobiia bacterium]|nr:PaaI family thioesterase [Acidimicrobiia bacterium]